MFAKAAREIKHEFDFEKADRERVKKTLKHTMVFMYFYIFIIFTK